MRRFARRGVLEKITIEAAAGETLEQAHAIATEVSLADVEFCEHYLRVTPMAEINPPPLLDGDDLKRLGVVPGPRFRELLELVRDAQLDDLIGTKEEALAFVRRICQM